MLHISFGITAYILFITFILGCCLGSFADCMAVRLVSGQSVLSGRSHCDSCGHVLGVLDLFPVLSWLLLKGKCRYCGAKIPPESFITELIAGIGCCLVVYRYDLSVMSLQGILLGLILLIVSLTDLHSWIIPDRLHVAGVLVFLATTVFMPDPLHNILRGLLLGIALGGGMLVLSLLFDRLTGKESLGGGDIKLLFYDRVVPWVSLGNFILPYFELPFGTWFCYSQKNPETSLWSVYCGSMFYYDRIWRRDDPVVYGAILKRSIIYEKLFGY